MVTQTRATSLISTLRALITYFNPERVKVILSLIIDAYPTLYALLHAQEEKRDAKSIRPGDTVDTDSAPVWENWRA